MSRFMVVNVNPVSNRPGFVTCQIARANTVVGGECIEVDLASKELLTELVDSTSDFASDLLKYGTHLSWCKYESGYDVCNCGFFAARARAKETA